MYQHSSKARDWSNLGGDLEAVFGGGAGPGQSENGKQGAAASKGADQDEWGDFAGFCPTSPAPLSRQSHLADPRSSNSTNMNSLPASNHTSPSPIFASPAASSLSINSTKLNIAPSLANPAQPSTGSGPTSAPFSLPPSSSVGCRLASLAESPVHRYKAERLFLVRFKSGITFLCSGSNHKQIMQALQPPGPNRPLCWTRMTNLETLPPQPPPFPLLPSHHLQECHSSHQQFPSTPKLPNYSLPVPSLHQCQAFQLCCHLRQLFFHWNPRLQNHCSRHQPCYHLNQ